VKLDHSIVLVAYLVMACYGVVAIRILFEIIQDVISTRRQGRIE